MSQGPALKGTVKLLVLAGSAKPSPKIGQALGPLGLNMMQFCKEFNERTTHVRNDVPVRVILKAYVDRSFKFNIKPPPTTWFLKKSTGLAIFMNDLGVLKGTDKAKYNKVGRIGMKYIYEIARVKQELDGNLGSHDLEGICDMIYGSCESMGLEIVEDRPSPDPIHIPLKKQ